MADLVIVLSTLIHILYYRFSDVLFVIHRSNRKMALIEMSSVEESILALIVSFELLNCMYYHKICVTPGCPQLSHKFQLSSTSVFYEEHHIVTL